MDNESVSSKDGLTKQQRKNKKKRESAKKKKFGQKENQEKQVKEDIDKPLADNHKKEQVKPEEDVDQFEEELCWCIQQLQLGLKTQKPTKDQISKSTKLLEQLRTNKTPKPKKRMLMKVNFGNYREKMAKEAKQKLIMEPKLVSVDERLINKSIFVKKKVNDLPPQSSSASASASADFCFNFPDPT